MADEFAFPRDGVNYYSDEVGRTLAGLFERDLSGGPKVGMLAVGPNVTAVTGAWRVLVDPFTYVGRNGSAVDLSGIAGAEQVEILDSLEIPAGQARIDLICWNPTEKELVPLPGTPAVNPVPPGAGALAPIARVRVNAGDGATISGQISPAFATTNLARGEGEVQRGSISHMAGGSLLGGSIYRSTNFEYTFPVPFEEIPHLQVTEAAGSPTVAQWVQVYELTRERFRFRILGVNAAPTAGVVYWEAKEK